MTVALRAGAAPTAATPAVVLPGWSAALGLGYERRGSRTVLVRNEHLGPLVVQKPLYPEGDALCHTILLHPPGGIAGGDRLAIDIDAGPAAQILLTTPGAAKWYKSNGRPAAQQVSVHAGTDAIVEWLPQETIVFDGADATSSLQLELAAGASAAGWDIVAFGRGAAGERFTQGRFRQSIEIRRESRLLWAEYGEVQGGDPLFDAAIGYAGRTVSGLLWVCGPDLDETALHACRAAATADGASSATRSTARMLTGVTCLPGGLTLARCLADSTEDVRNWLFEVWRVLRPLYAGRAAQRPRLWAT